jgi:hypothetical protein
MTAGCYRARRTSGVLMELADAPHLTCSTMVPVFSLQEWNRCSKCVLLHAPHLSFLHVKHPHAIPVSCSAGALEATRLARITQTGLLSIRRRSLIPARTHPLTALKTAPRPGVQGGGWLREALVVLRLFHGRLHLGAPTTHSAVLRLNLLSVGLAFTLSTSGRPLRVKLRRPRYCIIHPHPRLCARAYSTGSFDHHRARNNNNHVAEACSR